MCICKDKFMPTYKTLHCSNCNQTPRMQQQALCCLPDALASAYQPFSCCIVPWYAPSGYNRSTAWYWHCMLALTPLLSELAAQERSGRSSRRTFRLSTLLGCWCSDSSWPTCRSLQQKALLSTCPGQRIWWQTWRQLVVVWQSQKWYCLFWLVCQIHMLWLLRSCRCKMISPSAKWCKKCCKWSSEYVERRTSSGQRSPDTLVTLLYRKLQLCSLLWHDLSMYSQQDSWHWNADHVTHSETRSRMTWLK